MIAQVFEKFNPMLHGGVVDEIRNQGIELYSKLNVSCKLCNHE